MPGAGGQEPVGQSCSAWQNPHQGSQVPMQPCLYAHEVGTRYKQQLKPGAYLMRASMTARISQRQGTSNATNDRVHGCSAHSAHFGAAADSSGSKALPLSLCTHATPPPPPPPRTGPPPPALPHPHALDCVLDLAEVAGAQLLTQLPGVPEVEHAGKNLQHGTARHSTAAALNMLSCHQNAVTTVLLGDSMYWPCSARLHHMHVRPACLCVVAAGPATCTCTTKSTCRHSRR